MFLRVVAGLLIFVLSFILLIFILLQFPYFQDKTGKQIEAFLERKFGTEVSIGHTHFNLPGEIELEDVYLEDQQGDTILSAGRVYLELVLPALFSNKIHFTGAAISNGHIHLIRQEGDTTYNYQYMLEAFATDTIGTAAGPDTLKKPWDFIIDEITLDNVFFSLNDKHLGSYVTANTDTLHATTDAMDFTYPLVAFNRLYSKGTSIRIGLAKSTGDSTPPPLITTDHLTLEQFSLDIKDPHTGLDVEIRTDSLYAFVERFSLPDETLMLDDLILRRSFVRIDPGTTADTPANTQTGGGLGMPWVISVRETELTEDTIIFGNPTARNQFDPQNFRLDNLTASIEDLRLDSTVAEADILALTGRLDNRVNVNQLAGKLGMDQNRIRFNDLALRTGRSSLNASGSVDNYQSANPQVDVDLTARFPNDELLYFAPALASNPIFGNRGGVTYASGTAEGNLSSLDVDAELAILGGTKADVKGTIANLDNPPALALDLTVNSFSTTRSDLNSLVPASGITWPSTVSASGQLRGPLSNLYTNLAINTSFGDAKTDITLGLASGSELTYDGQINLTQFDVGALLNRTDIGTTSLTANVKGRGTNPATMAAEFDATVDHLVYQGTTYEAITLEGNIKNEIFTGSLASNQPGQNLAFEGSFSLTGKPDMNFSANVSNLDLGLFMPSMAGVRVQGAIAADLTGSSFRDLQGTLRANKVVFRKDGERYAIDSLYLESTRANDQTLLSIRSDVITGTVSGDFSVTALPQLLMAYIDTHFNLHQFNNAEILAEGQHFEYDLVISNGRIMALFIPGLQTTGTGFINGSFNSTDLTLDLTASLSELRFESSYVDSITVRANGTAESVDFNASAGEVQYRNLTLHKPHWQGMVADNLIASDFKIVDEEETIRYHLEPQILSLADGYGFKAGQDGLILNYQSWQTNADHLIRLTDGNLFINNLSLSREGESLTANTIAGINGDSLLNVDFNGFTIETITAIAGNDSSMITGAVNGNLQLTNFPTDLSFRADMAVNKLGVGNVILGDASVKATGEPGQVHQINATVTGNSDMAINGTFNPTDQALNIQAEIRKIDLAVAEGLSMGEIADSRGIVQGNLQINGTLKEPVFEGELNFPDAMINIAWLNAPMFLKNQTLTLTGKTIDFDNFTVLDTAGNEAIVTGKITHKGFTDMSFRLFVATDHFSLSNTEPGTNGMYYGNVVLSSNIILRGTDKLPVVRARIFLKEGTNITLIIPGQQTAVASRDGVVDYVDMDGDSLTNEGPDTLFAGVTGLDLEARIDIDEETRGRVMFNATADDYLAMTGGGSLVYEIAPDGHISLSGKYTLQEGNYHFSLYDLVTRDFNILGGSNIVWYGDPLTGQLDIQGVYEVRARARELLVSHAGPGVNYAYDERLPFEVHLDIGGEIQSPEIGFEIHLPEDEKNALGGAVYARLQQLNENESELNRQVFSLVVFNHFMTEDPFNTPGTQGSALIRNSVSQVLTNQLNTLGTKFLPGVDVSFNLESYDAPGSGTYGMTDLEVQLTKRMLDDRLLVQVGGDFDITGNQTQSATNPSEFAGDMSVEYKLTQDGRYRVRAFRNTEFESYIIQEYVATGLSLIFARDFDSFSNLFTKPEEIIPEPDESENTEEPIPTAEDETEIQEDQQTEP